MANTIKVKLGYAETEFTRTYTLTDVPDSALAPAKVKAAVTAFNNAVRDQSKSVDTFFTSNNGEDCTGVLEVIGESTHEETLMGGA